MNSAELERLTKLKQEIDKVEELLKMFTPDENRYRLRNLFFPKSRATSAKWGHTYGTDQYQYSLEREDVVAFASYFREKLIRLKSEFEGKEMNRE